MTSYHQRRMVRPPPTSSRARDILATERTVASALVAVRDIVRASGGAYVIEQVLQTIAAAARAELFEEVERSVGPLFDLKADELPFPVLSRCGQGHLEPQWTLYLAHTLRLGNAGRGDAAGPLGRRVARELLRLDTGLSSEFCDRGCHETADVKVQEEVFLGVRAGRGRSIDLLIEGETFAIGIEHKTVSGPSDGNDADGERGRQHHAYLDLLRARYPPGCGRTLLPVYLTPRSPPPDAVDWYPVRHEQLAQWMASELPSLKRSSSLATWSAAATHLADLVECHGSETREAYDALSAWQREPGNFGAACRLREAAQRPTFSVVSSILEVMHVRTTEVE